MYTHAHIYIHICTYTYTNTHICIHMDTHIHLHTHTHKYMHIYRHIHTCTDRHMHIYMHTHTHMDTDALCVESLMISFRVILALAITFLFIQNSLETKPNTWFHLNPYSRHWIVPTAQLLKMTTGKKNYKLSSAVSPLSLPFGRKAKLSGRIVLVCLHAVTKDLES